MVMNTILHIFNFSFQTPEQIDEIKTSIQTSVPGMQEMDPNTEEQRGTNKVL